MKKFHLSGFINEKYMKTGLYTIFILFNILCSVTAQENFELIKPEKIYLHTDRNVYIAGEYLFYTMYIQGGPDQMSKYAYLLIRDFDNSAVTHLRLEIYNQRAFGSIILSDTLKTGCYEIACYTNLMRNAEETFFRKEIVIANRFDDNFEQFPDSLINTAMSSSYNLSPDIPDRDQNIIINLNKLIFKPRELISFYVENMDEKGDQIASMSVSVSEFIQGTPIEPAISDYFDLIKENPGMKDISPAQCNFSPEFKCAVLQGRITSENKNGSVGSDVSNAVINHTVFLSTIDSIVNLQYTTTDSLGAFSFNLNPWYEGKEIIIRLKEKANANIDLDKKISITQPFVPSQAYNVPGFKDYLIQSGKIAQIQRYYNKKVVIDTQKVFRSLKAIPRVYYKTSSRIFPSDYFELPDFIEIAREIVPALRVWKKQDNYSSRYLNLRYRTDTDVETTIFLDGVPVDDINQVITLGSNDIRFIESLPAIRYYGEMSFPGILAVFSNNLEINNIRFKTPIARYRVLSSQCYTKPEPFKPENIIKDHPDLRQVLLWEPEFMPGKDKNQPIECYASDLMGKYRINIQGVTSNGDPVYGSAIITIQ